jgi:hypothetical protein
LNSMCNSDEHLFVCWLILFVSHLSLASIASAVCYCWLSTESNYSTFHPGHSYQISLAIVLLSSTTWLPTIATETIGIIE